MKQLEFLDRLFDVINETNILPIKDVITNEKDDEITACLSDGSLFTLKCEQCSC